MSYTNPREAWQSPAQPVVGPDIDWSKIDMVVIHYTAADNLIDGDPGENWNGIPAYLRSIQNDYTVNRGYSVGYSVAIDQRGVSWELRGVDIRNAANKGNVNRHKHQNDYPAPLTHNCNHHTIAILCLVDGNDSAQPGMLSEINRLIAWYQQLAGRTLKIVGHRDLDFTGCCGEGLYAQIRSGEISPQIDKVKVGMIEFDKRRLLDTRNLGSRTTAGQVITLDVSNIKGVKAATMNVTVTDCTGPGFVTVYPAGTARPNTSDLNYMAGWSICNQIDCPVDAAGRVSFYVKTPCHLIVDLVSVMYGDPLMAV